MFDAKKKLNYYQILEVAENATKKEIIEAYQRSKFIYDKDSMAFYTLYSTDEREEMLQQIEEAFRVLSNPEKRERYDRENNFNVAKSLVRIAYERPGSLTKKFIEVPDFTQREDMEDKSSSDEFDKAKNMVANASIPIHMAQKAPAYEVDDKIEEQIKNETEFSGAFFRRIRLYKNMSLGYVSERTKVSTYFLENIEQENFKKLPAKVYVRGFITNYAKLLSVNVEVALDAYLKRFDKSIK